MAMAAPVVVAHRLTRMAWAGPSPAQRDRKEFARMGQEKVDASRESWLAAAAGWTALTRGLLASWLQILEMVMAPFHRRVVSNQRRLQKL
jgi:hypothetical protein